jgi:hypothetical protein
MSDSPAPIRDIRSYYGVISLVLMGLSMLGGLVHYSLQKPEYVARCTLHLDDVGKHHVLNDPNNTEWLQQELAALTQAPVREHSLKLMDAASEQIHDVSWEILPYGDIIVTVRGADELVTGEYLKVAVKARRDIRRNERLAADAAKSEALMTDMIVIAPEPGQYERARKAAREVRKLSEKDPTGRSADHYLENFTRADPVAARVLTDMFAQDTDMNYYRYGDVTELHYTRELWKSMVYGFWVGLALISLILVVIDSLRKPVIPLQEEISESDQ